MSVAVYTSLPESIPSPSSETASVSTVPSSIPDISFSSSSFSSAERSSSDSRVAETFATAVDFSLITCTKFSSAISSSVALTMSARRLADLDLSVTPAKSSITLSMAFAFASSASVEIEMLGSFRFSTDEIEVKYVESSALSSAPSNEERILSMTTARFLAFSTFAKISSVESLLLPKVDMVGSSSASEMFLM